VSWEPVKLVEATQEPEQIPEKQVIETPIRSQNISSTQKISNFFFKKENDDVLPLLSGQFVTGNIIEEESLEHDKILDKKSVLLDLLSGQFHTETQKQPSNPLSLLPASSPDKKFLEDTDAEGQSDSGSNVSTEQDDLGEESDEALMTDEEENNDEHKEIIDSKNPSLSALPISPLKLSIPDKITTTSVVTKTTTIPPVGQTLFIEQEAEVEEDEFMNFGGADGEMDAVMDQYDPEFVKEADKEVIEDFEDIIQLHQ
jgi:hypothetical protein